MLSPFTHFSNLAPHGREGRAREKAVHQGLPEESTAGLMGLLCLKPETFLVGEVLEGSQLEQTVTGEAQRKTLGAKRS